MLKPPIPQDYFTSPLDITLVCVWNVCRTPLQSFSFWFGPKNTRERRPQMRMPQLTGYVSRIKISRYGYGKALYITHPNGYTTVYAHLQKVRSLSIEAYVKKQQYNKETFELELFPNIAEASHSFWLMTPLPLLEIREVLAVLIFILKFETSLSGQ